jgi:hypothetical protein
MGCGTPIDLYSRNMLNDTQTMKERNQNQNSLPDSCCILPRLMAKRDSKIPPAINNTQLMFIAL